MHDGIPCTYKNCALPRDESVEMPIEVPMALRLQLDEVAQKIMEKEGDNPYTRDLECGEMQDQTSTRPGFVDHTLNFSNTNVRKSPYAFSEDLVPIGVHDI